MKQYVEIETSTRRIFSLPCTCTDLWHPRPWRFPLSKYTLAHTNYLQSKSFCCHVFDWESWSFLWNMKAGSHSEKKRLRGSAEEEEKKKRQDPPVMFARSEGRLWSRCLIRSPSSAVARLLLRKGNTACFSNVCLCKYDDGEIFYLSNEFLRIIFAACSGWTQIFFKTRSPHITQHIPSLFKPLTLSLRQQIPAFMKAIIVSNGTRGKHVHEEEIKQQQRRFGLKTVCFLLGSPPPLYGRLYNNGAVSMAARAC